LLARQDARRLLIIGAGAVAESLIEAYPAVLSQIEQISVWNRSTARADALGAQYDITVETDLEAAVAAADIVVTATLSETPVLSGTLLQAGQHLDLIGAFTPTMREVDDVALTRARIFVDARETTLDHIGELLIPLKAGVITPEDIQGDLHDLATAREGRRTPEEITLYKNGGGGHLDLITARYILSVIATEV
jgi:ornithine cyclodeaminase